MWETPRNVLPSFLHDVDRTSAFTFVNRKSAPLLSIKLGVEPITTPIKAYYINYTTFTMKTAAILSLVVATVSAFAPQQQAPVSTALSAFDSELGAQKPLGFW